MRFPTPLLRARLGRRYKRFLSEHLLDDGRLVAAHCPNPGAMAGLLAEGAETWLSRAATAGRKLPYTWELVRADGALVGVNTMHPNRIAAEAIAAGRVAELAGYGTIRREVRLEPGTRLDLLLEGAGRAPCYVEVKNVHWRRGANAAFPDAVTARGARHLAALSRLAATGARAVMLYVVQRPDCRGLEIASDVDPGYAEAFRDALAAGVEALCYSCKLGLDAIGLDRALPVASPARRRACPQQAG